MVSSTFDVCRRHICHLPRSALNPQPTTLKSNDLSPVLKGSIVEEYGHGRNAIFKAIGSKSLLNVGFYLFSSLQRRLINHDSVVHPVWYDILPFCCGHMLWYDLLLVPLCAMELVQWRALQCSIKLYLYKTNVWMIWKSKWLKDLFMLENLKQYFDLKTWWQCWLLKF